MDNTNLIEQEKLTATGFDLDTTPDLSEQEEQGTLVHIADATGKKMYDVGQPVTMTVVGTYSRTYRRVSASQRDRLLQLRRSKVSDELLTKNEHELVASCVTAWSGFKSKDQPIPFSKENVISVLQRFPYVLEQLREEMGDRENFTARSSTSFATP